MVMLAYLNIPSGMWENLADAMLLTIISAPLIFRWVITPVSQNLAVQAQLQESVQTLQATVAAMVSALESRDSFTAGHQTRVADLACAIARDMGWDEHRIEGLRLGALIHDIGKIQVPAEILSRTTKLTEVEYKMVQTHCETGYKILKDIPFLWPVADIAHQHHERLDGTGYPQGLKGDEICLEARIVAVADVVEAISSHRPYRPALGIDTALKEIKSKRGKLYDPDTVDACLKLFAEKKFSFGDSER